MTRFNRHRLIALLIILLTGAVILSAFHDSTSHPMTDGKEGTEQSPVPSDPVGTDREAATGESPDARGLICKHTDILEYYDSIQNPKKFTLTGRVAGGIVPHHLVAASYISGFFKAVAESIAEYGEQYDTVVIVAPNHAGETGDIVISYRDWQLEETLFCDHAILDAMYPNRPDGFVITQNDDRMEEEHSVSVLIPYIDYYLPDAKVAAFLLNRRLTFECVNQFSDMLADVITASGKRVLLIGSVDFSHYLPVDVAAANDRITEAAIVDRNYKQIHQFSNDYVDSPQSLNTFLMTMQTIGADTIDILYNTDMSEFFGAGITETTTYFFIAAYDEALS